jgi:hypothetical protein
MMLQEGGDSSAELGSGLESRAATCIDPLHGPVFWREVVPLRNR